MTGDPGRLEELAAEREKLNGQLARLSKRADSIRGRLFEIAKQERRERMKAQAGVSEGVRVAARGYSGKYAFLNDALGTLVKVNRTRAVVDYGEHGELSIPIVDLIAADDPQGFIVGVGTGT